MSEQGDKVRLTPKPREIIGEVAEIVPDECMRLVSGPDVYALRYWDVEVLERADDPSRDSIGTVAELDGHVWIKRSEQWWQPIPTEVGSRTNSRMTGRTVTGAVPGTPAAQAQGEADETAQALVHKRSLLPHALRFPADVLEEAELSHDDITSREAELLDAAMVAHLREIRRLMDVGKIASAPADPAPQTEARPEPLVVQYGDPEPDRSKKFTTRLGQRLHRSSSGHGWSGPTFILEYQWDRLPEPWFPLTEAEVNNG